jgi:acyl-CoA reductase-like NAD-dependent aldehyde dehydrogenase
MTTVHEAGSASFPLTVNGADFEAAGSFDVINPSTGRVFAQAPAISASQLDAVFEDADAVARANRTSYGLTASVWSADQDRALSLAAQIDSGQVSINSHGGGVRVHLPFGGHKWSGIGVENGPWGLYGFTEIQVITGPPRKQH